MPAWLRGWLKLIDWIKAALVTLITVAALILMLAVATGAVGTSLWE